ncbi:hypothetical protein ACFPAF_16840 [Hymenobacter endophyticus]|uniref:Uncharacterized protein n=1 Tax=Hymenobacter endophyticus TaxID=3076335 RepID=A0ABU3TL23_9BACT|nr:hypothetical protein [Hymenobacter endophyticus]MDU0372071.1 hypothetical protein [Hymenobacter endophyticus]
MNAVCARMEACQSTLSRLAAGGRILSGGAGHTLEPTYRYYWVSTPTQSRLLVYAYPEGERWGGKPIIYYIQGEEITGPTSRVPAPLGCNAEYLADLFTKVMHEVDSLDGQRLLEVTTPARATWLLATYLHRPDRIPESFETVLLLRPENAYAAAYVRRWQPTLATLMTPAIVAKVLAMPEPVPAPTHC